MSDTTITATQNALACDFRFPSLLRFALPSILMMVFVGLYTIVDTIFVSRFVDTNALSAINIICPMINLITGLGAMLATGGSAVIAHKMGRGDNRGANQSFSFIVLIGAVSGLLLTAVGLIFLKPIVYGLGASDLLFDYCHDYYLVLVLFIPANLLQIIFQNLFVTAGRPRLGMWLVIAAGLINVGLDYVFIVPLRMGISGAALSDGIGFTITTAAGFIFFARSKGTLTLTRPRFDWRLLGRSCANGSSEMISQLSMAVTTFLFNAAMMARLGEDGVAAITIMIYSQFFLSTLFIGFSIGVAPVISFNHGGQNHARLKRIFRICCLFISVVSAVVFVGAMLLSPGIVSLFSPAGTPVYQIAGESFRLFSVSFLFCGFNIFASAMFTALSDAKSSAAISFLRTFGFTVAGLLLLPLVLDVLGIWIAVPLAELLTLFLSVLLVLRRRSYYQYL